MKVDKESIKKVLALFDDEDIPFIKSELLLALLIPEENVEKLKALRLGEKNDKRGK